MKSRRRNGSVSRSGHRKIERILRERERQSRFRKPPKPDFSWAQSTYAPFDHE
jgi:hypothetical protein